MGGRLLSPPPLLPLPAFFRFSRRTRGISGGKEKGEEPLLLCATTPPPPFPPQEKINLPFPPSPFEAVVGPSAKEFLSAYAFHLPLPPSLILITAPSPLL